VEPEATAPSTASPPSSGADTPRPPNEQIALDVPKPQLPPGNAVDSLAERITWLRDYKGGNCFFATASSVGQVDRHRRFGTAVEPFAEMLAAFQSRFNLEPDISVAPDRTRAMRGNGVPPRSGGNRRGKTNFVARADIRPERNAYQRTLETFGGLRPTCCSSTTRAWHSTSINA
jgi:hypothetical protein